MATPILDIGELANGQVDQYLTANASTRAIEAAANDFLSVDLSAGNATLTAAQYRGYVLFRSSGNTVARDLTLQAIKRLVVVENGGTATLSVKLGTTTITISAGEAGLLYSDGTANGLTSVASGGGGGATTSILSPDTATTHTATSTDNGGLLIFNSSSDCTLTVPQTSTEALDAGFHVLALNEGGGNLSVAIEGSDTIDGVKLWADATQAVTVIKDTAGSPNDWRMIGNSWMPEAVENDALTAPPATPAVGAVYIPAATATGTWATHENEFAIHLGSDVYDFVTPPVGLGVYEKTSAVWIGWNDTSWVDIQAAAPVGNVLINGDGVVSERTIGTAINDDSYAFDRWVILSDGNGVVTPTQEAADLPAGARSAMKLTVAVANKKFGMVQIVEGKNCKHLISSVASLSAKAKASGLANLRVAILSWAGTEDTVTSDVVSTWNAAGADPTLATSWTYENTPVNISLSTSWASNYLAENISIDTASTKQVAAFVWADDTDGAVSDYLLLTDVQLEKGTTATDFEYRPFGEEAALCQRYFQVCPREMMGTAIATTDVVVSATLPVVMRVSPSLTLTSTSPYTESPYFLTVVTPSGTASIVSGPHLYTSSIGVRITGYTGLTVGDTAMLDGTNLYAESEL